MVFLGFSSSRSKEPGTGSSSPPRWKRCPGWDPAEMPSQNGWFIYLHRSQHLVTLWCIRNSIYIYMYEYIYLYEYESTSEHVWRLLTWLAKTDRGGHLHWMAKIYSFLSVSVCTNADTRDWARRAVGRSKAEYILATHQSMDIDGVKAV